MGDEGGTRKASPQRAHERSVVRRGAAFLHASEQKRPNPRVATLGQMSNVAWHASHVRASRVRRARPLHRREQKRPQSVADAYLAELVADPARVKRLCGWDWLTAALDALPAA